MDFSPKQRLAITKAIINLTNPSRNSGFAKNILGQSSRFEDNRVVFHHNERRNIPSHHNHSCTWLSA